MKNNKKTVKPQKNLWKKQNTENRVIGKQKSKVSKLVSIQKGHFANYLIINLFKIILMQLRESTG